MSAPALTLYGYWRSSSAWRVRLALELKQVAYVNQPVHLVRDGGEQHATAHRQRNPMRQVPVLAVTQGDRTVHLTQSLAIVQWLDAHLDGPRVLPEDGWAAARAWELAEVVNSGTQPLQNLAVLNKVTALGGDRRQWGHDAIVQGLAAVEALAADTGHPAAAGTYLVGDSPSLADICLVPQLYNARRFGVDLSAFPTLTRVEVACSALPAFQAAHPDAQPDAVVA